MFEIIITQFEQKPTTAAQGEIVEAATMPELNTPLPVVNELYRQRVDQIDLAEIICAVNRIGKIGRPRKSVKTTAAA